MTAVSLKIHRPPDWTRDAICAEVGIGAFYPEGEDGRGQHYEIAAKAICAGCPVREQCLEYALAYESGEVEGADWNSSFGVWGGKTPQERRRLIRERQGGRARRSALRAAS